MTNIRLLPVVVLAIAALLVFKTLGLITNGGYVLGAAPVLAAVADDAFGLEADMTVTPADEPTLEDNSPTLIDEAPMLEVPATKPDEAVPVASGAEPDHAPVESVAVLCRDADAVLTEAGELVLTPADAAGEPRQDCLPSGDAMPTRITAEGSGPLPGALGGPTATEQQLLERLAERRGELQQYEQDLAMRSSIVDAAEKRIEERAATLAALEAQISTLVDQRTEMETGQFASIVAMYEAMKPRDAARIFNNLDMEVLLRVAKTMSPRKMAPVLAEMEPARAQELTVRMAALADRPPTEMTPNDLAALPQIVGQ